MAQFPSIFPGSLDTFENHGSRDGIGLDIDWQKSDEFPSNELDMITDAILEVERKIINFSDELADLTDAEIQQLQNIDATTISIAQWGYLGACGAGGGQLLAALTAAESTQLENIGATTISAIQWGMLGAGVEWTDWVPNLVGGADLSGYEAARYFRIGDICFYAFNAENRNVTTPGIIQITLPFTSANVALNFVPTAMVNDGAAEVGQPVITFDSNTNFLNVYKSAAAGNWGGGEVGVYIRICGFFEIA